MSIIGNEACPECQARGHDKRGNHLMVFEDGGKFCNRKHFHANGFAFYLAPDGTNPILDKEIDGSIKYTVDQFKELKLEGKLDDPNVRAVALAGMRGADRWEVSSALEQEEMLRDRKHDEDYFEQLRVKNLVSRHIRGEIAKFYNVRVGVDEDGKVARHYYPVYDGYTGEWKGAKCRTLPKDFKYGHLGWTWGRNQMFGQQTLTSILDAGGRMDTLLLVGGECDAMAAQQMLRTSRKGTKYEDIPFHVWSPTKGEKALQEIVDNKDTIKKFKKIIVGFDNDEVGSDLNKAVARMFPGKTYTMLYPTGCKDANDALMYGKGREFVDGWFNPEESAVQDVVKKVTSFTKAAKETPTMGLSWPWPSMDDLTLGIREHTMYTIGAGSGVGKTEFTKKVCFHLLQEHKRPVGVIYLEEPPKRTTRVFAGHLINKRIELPIDETKPDRDYTEEDADAAIDKLGEMELYIADLSGEKKLSLIMECLNTFLAYGIRDIVVDNLTVIEMDDAKRSKVEAIDDAMKQLGKFKDENPVSLFLISHLTRPRDREPHERGGEVHLADFRGSGSISFWSNFAIGIERNAEAESEMEKRITTIRIVKDRETGLNTGKTLALNSNPETGAWHEMRKIDKNFDTGADDFEEDF